MMSRPNQFVNTFYLAVHLGLNILVVVLIINLIDVYIPVKHLFAGSHINLQHFYSHIDLQKSVALVIALGVAVWYYQKKKAGTGNHAQKH
jgi:hypothetical protein